MNFSPHHTFANCSKLERTVLGLNGSGNVPAAVFSGYENYHFSLVHKLRSAKYHFQSLEGYLSSSAAQTDTPEDLVYRVNFHFDGFLHVLGSALDIFAREVLTYFNMPLPTKVYYQTARDTINTNRAGDPILTFLADPTWRKEFSDYRNTATHESLIGTTYTMSICVQGGGATKKLVFPVPDNPRAAVKVFKKNPDIVVYCSTTLKRALTHFNVAYGHIEQRARAGGALPL